jgi:hypothetical protein
MIPLLPAHIKHLQMIIGMQQFQENENESNSD